MTNPSHNDLREDGSGPQGAGSGEPAAPATGRECWVEFGPTGKPSNQIPLMRPPGPDDVCDGYTWVRMVEPLPSPPAREDGEPSGTASLRGAARLEEPGKVYLFMASDGCEGWEVLGIMSDLDAAKAKLAELQAMEKEDPDYRVNFTEYDLGIVGVPMGYIEHGEAPEAQEAP